MFVVFPKYSQFLTRVYDWCHPRAAEMTGSAPNRDFIPLDFGIRLDSTRLLPVFGTCCMTAT